MSNYYLPKHDFFLMWLKSDWNEYTWPFHSMYKNFPNIITNHIFSKCIIISLTPDVKQFFFCFSFNSLLLGCFFFLFFLLLGCFMRPFITDDVTFNAAWWRIPFRSVSIFRFQSLFQSHLLNIFDDYKQRQAVYTRGV